MNRTAKNNFLSVLSLFTSFSTLVCCALPMLLVVIGLGAVVSGVVTDFPFLVALSRYKIWIFAGAALLIGFNFYLLYGKKTRAAECEVVPGRKETACEVASRWSKVVLWVSLALLVIGFAVSYLLVPMLRLFED